jgi:hypothetical protein
MTLIDGSLYAALIEAGASPELAAKAVEAVRRPPSRTKGLTVALNPVAPLLVPCLVLILCVLSRVMR